MLPTAGQTARPIGLKFVVICFSKILFGKFIFKYFFHVQRRALQLVMDNKEL